MRRFFLFVFTLFAFPGLCLAADWGSYENGRFGYVIDVPPDFAWGEESQNGDGRVFTSGDGRLTLRAYGGNVIADDFEAETRSAMGFATDGGWALSYERVTPSWASWSGERSGMILYARTISVCEGTQFARFEFEYPKTQLKELDRVVDRLVQSFRETDAGAGC
jgi:hypothetical protein